MSKRATSAHASALQKLRASAKAPAAKAPTAPEKPAPAAPGSAHPAQPPMKSTFAIPHALPHASPPPVQQATAAPAGKPATPVHQSSLKDARTASAGAPNPQSGKSDDRGKSNDKTAAAKKAEHKKAEHKKLGRQSLQEYLEKAGFEIGQDKVRRIVKLSLSCLFVLLSIVLVIIGVTGGAAVKDIIIGIIALWSAVFAACWLLVWGVIYFVLDYRIYQRTKELEEVLPDFLQLASANISAGMPIDKALWYAIRPNFGVLAKEMEDVAKATMAGEDLEASLMRMTKRYDSVVLRRSMNILVEGLNAGGEMADLLNKIALNIEEMKIMKKEMAASVTTYAIFITFASVAIAPFLFALATELLSIIIKITGSLDLSASSSMITLAAPSADAITNFKIFSVFMLLISTAFSASIVSVIKKGSVFEGIKTIPVYAAIALVIYFIALTGLHAMMGNII